MAARKLSKGIIEKLDKRTGKRTLYARIVRNGKQYTLKADNLSHAKRLRRELEDKYQARGEAAISGDKMTFRELAERYKERKLVPAQFHGEGDHRRKVAGLKSWQGPLGYARTLIDAFGFRLVREITHSDIEDFKMVRLATPTKQGAARAVASVNRELETLRAILRFGRRQRWIAFNPFEEGSPLVSKSDEVRRERILSYEEEAELLAACTGRRAHLRAILIIALDSAMRRGEVFKLARRDVDLAAGTLTVRAVNSKTDSKRVVPIMTPRLRTELEKLLTHQSDDPDELVFGITDNVKWSFNAAKTEAGVEDFRLHDCRHTATTRMVQAGIPSAEVMKITGHSQVSTFLRYLNPTGEAHRRAADLLSAYNDRQGAISNE